MTPTPQRFEVNQNPDHGGCLLFGGWIAAIIGLSKAKSIIQTEADRFNLEVVKAGLGLPLGTNAYIWQDLVTFVYSDWDSDTIPSLQLRWRDDIYQTFWGGDTKALYDYLHTFFPEKETEAPQFSIG